MGNYFEMFFQALIESSDDFIYINDCQAGTFRYSPGLVELLPLPSEVLTNPLPIWKEIVHPDDWERFYNSNMAITNNLTDEHLVEFRACKRTGEYIWLRCKGRMRRDLNNKPLFFAGAMTLMGKQNKIDNLTQLLNHNEFYSSLEKFTQSEQIKTLAVIMIDIDDFSQINEIYGRDTGDQIITLLSNIIQSTLPTNATAYRLEKDKMGILMTNCKESEVEILYNNINDKLLLGPSRPFIQINFEVSAGCCMYPKNGKYKEELYLYTDYALQKAKKDGKNRLTFFEDKMLIERREELNLLYHLRQDLNNGCQNFSLNFQPQVDPNTKQIVGIEVLMRWKNENNVPVSPSIFIPIMEKYSLINQISNWLLTTTFQTTKKWIKDNPNLTISVNISAIQLLDYNFLHNLFTIIEAEDFPAQNLIIEMTESYAFKNIEPLKLIFDEIKTNKIKIALDDFGTGYSSLSELKHTPVDIVKIDKSFVKDVLTSDFDAHFIRLVTDICHTVDITVCLEGVETDAEYNFIKDMGIDYIQGCYFAKPMDTEAMEKLLYQNI